MKRAPGNRPRVSLAYRLLDAWMRLVSLLVPPETRGGWREEWDGELWVR